MKDATQVSKKWSTNLAGSAQAITDGVNRVTQAPGVAAVAQKAAYVAGVQANADKWGRNTAAVSLQEWQQATISKGVPRIASGATAAEPKFEAFMGKLLPFIDGEVRKLPPRGGLEQNINRATMFMRGMTKFQK